jgi:hypothetical protein
LNALLLSTIISTSSILNLFRKKRSQPPCPSPTPYAYIQEEWLGFVFCVGDRTCPCSRLVSSSWR